MTAGASKRTENVTKNKFINHKQPTWECFSKAKSILGMGMQAGLLGTDPRRATMNLSGFISMCFQDIFLKEHENKPLFQLTPTNIKDKCSQFLVLDTNGLKEANLHLAEQQEDQLKYRLC